MATYTELFGLRNDSELRNKVVAAVAVQADVIRNEPGATANHANRVLWAKDAFTKPEAEAGKMVWALLAANKAATVASRASDAAVLTAMAAFRFSSFLLKASASMASIFEPVLGPASFIRPRRPRPTCRRWRR